MRFKKWLAQELRPEVRKKPGLSATNWAISILIVIGTLVAILETEASLRALTGSLFLVLESVLFAVFLLEYLARWYVADVPDNAGEVQSRWQYLCSFWALLDLMVLVSFAMYFMVESLFYMRLFRLLRIVRIARLGRFSRAMELVLEALASRKFEIFFTFCIAMFLMIMGAGVLYMVEAEHQPEAFGSIPRALWWSIATLTTVGYGDVTPVTVAGKFAAGITAIFGIGLVAMPAGILASAFSEAIQRRDHQDKHD